MTALITAVIPTYKRPQLLKRAVRSVLAQTYPFFQILIADNASGEATDRVIQEFMQQDARIKVLRQSSNVGIAANFQAALMHVITPYVCFLPDDDFYAPTFFEETIAPFTKYPDIAFSGGGGVAYFDEKYQIRELRSGNQRLTTGYYPSPTALRAHLKSTSGIQLPTLLLNTLLAKKVGGFDTRLGFGIDADLIVKCTAQFPVYIITDHLFYFYFQNSESLSHAYDLISVEKECVCMQENLLATPLSQKDREEFSLWFREWHTRIYSKLYGIAYSEKKFSEAHHYAEKICALTHSSKWKCRKRRAALYGYLPFLFFFYSILRKFEKGVRNWVKPKKISIPEPILQYQPHPQAAQWKEFALQLMCD